MPDDEEKPEASDEAKARIRQRLDQARAAREARGELPLWAQAKQRDDVELRGPDLAYVGPVRVEMLERGWECHRHPGVGIIPSVCDHVWAVQAELEKVRVARARQHGR